MSLSHVSISKYLDFANHHADATPEAIKGLCEKVKKFGFHSVFVNPSLLPLAKDILGEGRVVGTVIAFPLGQETKETKVFAAIEATRKRADELDVSMNVGQFKSGDLAGTLAEMKAVVGSVRNIRSKTVVKFIIETGFLTDKEIKKASELVVKSGADFVKTCSGWGPRGASLKDMALIKEAIGDQVKIKVAGGIDTYRKAIDFISAGAHRIGTSKAVEIVEGRKDA